MNWYAIQTKPHREEEAEMHLQRQGFTVYLPRIQVIKSRRGRRQPAVEPLFPRYLFVQLDPALTDRAPIRSTRGVSAMVEFGNVPAEVPADVISALQEQEDDAEGVRLLPADKFISGERGFVADGPLAGLEGIFVARNGTERVYVLLEVLGTMTRCSLRDDQFLKSSV